MVTPAPAPDTASTEPGPAVPAAPRSAHRSLWADAWRRLIRNRMAVICGCIFLAIAIFSFLGPTLAGWLAGLDGAAQNTQLGVTPPSWQHWLGTDNLGRDMLVRTMEGGAIAITVALVATLVALVIGISWGAIAA